MASDEREPLDAGPYIEELNRRLAARGLFEAGMRFVNMPTNSDGVQITGIDWEGARFHQAMFLEVASDVARSYVLQAGADDAALSDTFAGYVEGQHVHEATNELFRYSVRFNDGPEPRWQAQVSRGDGVRVGALEGKLLRNALGGSALKGAVAAAVETLIDVMEVPGEAPPPR